MFHLHLPSVFLYEHLCLIQYCAIVSHKEFGSVAQVAPESSVPVPMRPLTALTRLLFAKLDALDKVDLLSLVFLLFKFVTRTIPVTHNITRKSHRRA